MLVCVWLPARRVSCSGARRGRVGRVDRRPGNDDARPDDRRASRRRGHAAHRVSREGAPHRDGVSVAHARRRRPESDRQRARRRARHDPHGRAACGASARRRPSVLRARVRFRILKTLDETLEHWPKDSMLKDAVAIVRAFRPQVIIAVFTRHAGRRPRPSSVFRRDRARGVRCCGGQRALSAVARRRS